MNAGSGAITATGAVGVSNALGNVILNSSGTTTLTGSIGGSAVTAVGAANLTTDAGGTTAINTPNIRTSGAQTFNDAVTLGANTTLNTAQGNVTFAQTVNGSQSLTISASGTGTGTGDVLIKGAAGSTTPLTKVDISAQNISLGNVTTTNGDQNYQARGLLFLNSTYKTNGGSINIGNTARNSLTAAVTVWKSTTGDLVFDLTGSSGSGGSLTFQQYERVVVTDGSLKIIGANAVQLPDAVAGVGISIESKSLNIVGERILAPKIEYNAQVVTVAARLNEKNERPLVVVLGTADANLTGTGLVVGGLSLALLDSSMYRSGTLILKSELLGGIGVPFDTAIGTNASLRFTFPTPEQLPAVSRTDIAALLASGVPSRPAFVPQESAIPVSLMEQMKLIGIYTRGLSEAEARARFAKSAVYEQLVFNPDAAPEQFEVVDIRLSEAGLRNALKTYNEIFMADAPDGTKIFRATELQQTLSDAYRRYQDSNPNATSEGFRAYLENDAGGTQNAAALAFIRRMGDLFRQIEYLGLTFKEIDISKSTLLRQLGRITGLSSSALRQNIEQGRTQAAATPASATPAPVPATPGNKTAGIGARSENGPGQ